MKTNQNVSDDVSLLNSYLWHQNFSSIILESLNSLELSWSSNGAFWKKFEFFEFPPIFDHSFFYHFLLEFQFSFKTSYIFLFVPPATTWSLLFFFPTTGRGRWLLVPFSIAFCVCTFFDWYLLFLINFISDKLFFSFSMSEIDFELTIWKIHKFWKMELKF